MKAHQGIITALVTPFLEDGSIDWKSWDALLQDQIRAGVQGVIPCGTTGESPTLSLEEKRQLIESAIRHCKGRHVSVVAGTGGNSTRETVELSAWASEAGADGVLVVTPYYNKPSQSGLYEHFNAVASAVKCPVVLYNVPGRTGVGIAPETVARLAENPRIRHIKEATGNVALTSEIIEQCRLAGTQITVLSGDDATMLPLLSIGARGVISVASNLFPRAMVALQSAYDAGQVAEARKIHLRFYPLFRDLFVESNPVPIKAALAWVGLGTERVREPLWPLAESSRQKLVASLVSCGFSAGGGTL